MGHDASLLYKMTQEEIISHIKSWGPVYHQYEPLLLQSGISGSVITKMEPNEVDDFCDLIAVADKAHRLKFRVVFMDLHNKILELESPKYNIREDMSITTSLTQQVPLTLTLGGGMMGGLAMKAATQNH